MNVVLKHIVMIAWARDRLEMSVRTSSAVQHTSGDAIRASSLTCIGPAQCSTHVGWGECEWLVVSREPSPDGCILGLPVKTSIKVAKLVYQGDVVGLWGGVGGFVIRDGLDTLPHPPGVGSC